MPSYYQAEQEIIKSIKQENEFIHEGAKYRVDVVDKPRPEKGECKTDIYVSATSVNAGIRREFKISVKKDNADFLENKVSAERAEQIFGMDYESVIHNCVKEIDNSFVSTPAFYVEQSGKTQAGSFTLGWKFELLNKLSGKKSGKVKLTEEQKLNVYSGSGADKAKKDCSVNNQVIKNSGVANYILVVDKDFNYSTSNIFKAIKPIEKYSRNLEVFFSCKALNYRIEADKWDGDRPLAVSVDWDIKNNTLIPYLNFNACLKIKGNEVGNKLRNQLKSLNITSIDQLKENQSFISEKFHLKK
jgi:hypothetical protein